MPEFAEASEFEAMRAAARGIFLATLEGIAIEAAFQRHLEYHNGVLRIGEDLYSLREYSRVFVLSFGKAAQSMAQALTERIGVHEGIVACPALPGEQLHGFQYFQGGHPEPNAESLSAARAALRSLSNLDRRALAIFLLSGGGSSILERPVSNAIGLKDLAATYRALVHSGAGIAEINAVRKHISAVKGGRLAVAAAAARQVSILVSDVPDDAPDALASGPTMPDSSNVDDCYRIADRYKLLALLPEAVRGLFERQELDETPKADDPAFVNSRWWTILSSRDAQRKAAERAAQSGFTVEIEDRGCDWEYAKAADFLLDRLRQLRRRASPVCLVSGGEVAVRVPANCGTGGRNQQFALYCADRVASQNIAVLSAGTDGVDGNSPAAGAVVDGTTVSRAGVGAVSKALAEFNAFPLLDRLNDTVVTGPTGNNVRDLRILFAW